MEITAYRLAERYLGVAEFNGSRHHPLIQWWHKLGLGYEIPDEVPWCASFVAGIAWELGLARPHHAARARSWLTVGEPVLLADARRGWDVVVLQRGAGPQPGPDVLDAAGHVGWFHSLSGLGGGSVAILGGNQGNRVSVESYATERVLGVRRLWGE